MPPSLRSVHRLPNSRRLSANKGPSRHCQGARALEHMDGRAESPMESEARLVFIEGGLPTPELQ